MRHLLMFSSTVLLSLALVVALAVLAAILTRGIL